MISKELLSEVTGDSVTNVTYENEILTYAIKGVFGYKEPNVYELAYKCKEWALTHNNDIDDNGYYIFNTRYKVDDYETKITEFEVCVTKLNYGYRAGAYNGVPKFSGSTEPEAIFKACQWILDNKKNKKVD